MRDRRESRRGEIESSHRPGAHYHLTSDFLSALAVIRDQKPMSDAALRKCLQGMEPRQWYETLNRKVFFWMTRDRLLTLLSARAYKNRAHCVLTISTAGMVERHLQRVTLSPINSGCTVPNPQPRGRATFLPIEAYPFEEWVKKRRNGQRAIVEFAVDYSVPDIGPLVVRVDRMKAGLLLETLWQRSLA